MDDIQEYIFVATEGQKTDVEFTKEQEEVRDEAVGKLLDILDIIARGIDDTRQTHELIYEEEQLRRETLLKAMFDIADLQFHIGQHALPVNLAGSLNSRIRQLRIELSSAQAVSVDETRRVENIARELIMLLYPGKTSSEIQDAIRSIPGGVVDLLDWKNFSPEERDSLILPQARMLYIDRYFWGEYPEISSLLGLTGDKEKDDGIIRAREAELEATLFLSRITARIEQGTATADEMFYQQLVERIGVKNLFAAIKNVEEGRGTDDESAYSDFIKARRLAETIDIATMRKMIESGTASDDEILFYKLSTRKRRTQFFTDIMVYSDFFRGINSRLKVLSDYANALSEKAQWLRKIPAKNIDLILGEAEAAQWQEHLDLILAREGVTNKEVNEGDGILDNIFRELFPDIVVNSHIDRKKLEGKLGVSMHDSFFENLNKHAERYLAESTH